MVLVGAYGTVAVMLGGMFLFGWFQQFLCATVGVILIASASMAGNQLWTLIGATNLVTWLLLRAELREGRKVWAQKPLLLDNVNVGSAKLLRGKVQILHLFVDTPRHRWRPRSRRATMRHIRRACKWIASNAKTFGTSLQFEHKIANTRRACYHGDIPRQENNHTGMEAFQAFLQERLDDLTSESGAGQDDLAISSNCCLVVHLAEYIGHEAYAVPAYRNRTSGPVAVEYAVVGAWKNAAIYAHEILHLFGADDFRRSKYIDTSMARQWDEQTDHMLRRSIMFDGYYSLNHVVVDNLTAQCVGWL